MYDMVWLGFGRSSVAGHPPSIHPQYDTHHKTIKRSAGIGRLYNQTISQLSHAGAVLQNAVPLFAPPAFLIRGDMRVFTLALRVKHKNLPGV